MTSVSFDLRDYSGADTARAVDHQEDSARSCRRPEHRRTSIWLVLPEGCRWSEEQRETITSWVAATGILLADDSLRAFVGPGAEVRLFSQLLPLSDSRKAPLWSGVARQ